jgi:hypothetical protein
MVRWSAIRDLHRRAEIGTRAVELLDQVGRGCWCINPRAMQEVAEPILADARAAGMVK